MEEKYIPEMDFPEKDYEATFDVLMPSNAKATVYKLNVKAAEPIEALAMAIEEWKRQTEPADIRVKEIKSKKHEAIS